MLYMVYIEFAFPQCLTWEIVFSKGSCNNLNTCRSTADLATLSLGTGENTWLLWLKSVAEVMLCHLWSWVIKYRATSALFFALFMFAALSWHMVNPILCGCHAMRKPKHMKGPCEDTLRAAVLASESSGTFRFFQPMVFKSPELKSQTLCNRNKSFPLFPF